MPSDAASHPGLNSPETLLAALLQQPDSRLQLAIVPLLLRNPGFADHVPLLVARLDAPQALVLQTLYMAAVYMQRHWQSRLGLYLDDMILLPDLFSQPMGLARRRSVSERPACTGWPTPGRRGQLSLLPASKRSTRQLIFSLNS